MNHTKMDLLFKERAGIFTCNKCGLIVMTAEGLLFADLNKQYDKFRADHKDCLWTA